MTLEVVSVLPGRLVFEPNAGLIKASSTQVLGCTTTSVAADKTVVPGAGTTGRFDFNLDLDLGFSGIGGEPPDRKMITLMGSAVMSTTTTMHWPTKHDHQCRQPDLGVAACQ